MKTMFLRIFLSFWLAMGLIIATSIIISATVSYRRLQVLDAVEPSDLADQAVARLARDGKAGLLAWIGEAEGTYDGLLIFIIDPHGADIASRTLPERIVRRVRDLEKSGALGGIDGKPVQDITHRVPQFVGPEGKIFTLMLTFAGYPPFAVLRTPDVNLALLAVAFLFSGLICWWLALYLSKPVTRLQDVARSVAAGNLDARVSDQFANRHDELGVLARDFDRMAEYLRSLIASKETLLSDMSHELRSPLARLRVALGLARREGADLPKQLGRIELETERLDALIGQILHLSTLTSGEPKLHRERVDLTGLLNDVVEDARLEAGAEGKRVAWSPAKPVTLEADPQLLRSAIENVLRNAVRFTDVDTAVEVALTREDRSLLITIRDQGPGVPDQDLARIFEPFYRVADARDRDSGGTGLGLAITARVVTLHNGKVTAHNGSPRGLVIEIRLPA
jgi:two-component system, OmpR family, sensor kinase